MKYMTTLQILTISVLVAGCASAPGGLQAPPTNIACIEGGFANFRRHFTQGEAHVTVIPEVNRRQANPYGHHCMPAGKATLFVGAGHGMIFSNELVLVSLDGGHQYQVRASLNSSYFRFLIVDVTSATEKITYEFQMKYGMFPSAGQARDLSAQRLLTPGQLFAGSVINIRVPNSEGWMLMDSSNQGMIITRRGDSPDESYVARVVAVALPESKDRDEFVALIKQGYQKETSTERLKSIELNYEYTEKRGYPCVRIKGVAEDTKAITPSGQAALKLQSYTLICRHPRQQRKGFEGFSIEFSHRGPSFDAALDAQAEAFIEGVQVPEK